MATQLHNVLIPALFAESSLSENLGWFMVILGIGILIVATRHLRKGSNPNETYVQEAPISPRINRELHSELDGILLRIQEVSREAIGRLDTKIRLLDQLIKEADAAAERLENATQQMNAAPPQNGSNGPAPQPAAEPKAPAIPLNPLHQKVYALADQGMDINEICRITELDRGEVELIFGLRRMN